MGVSSRTRAIGREELQTVMLGGGVGMVRELASTRTFVVELS